jgi:hypothetical protein
MYSVLEYIFFWHSFRPLKTISGFGGGSVHKIYPTEFTIDKS